MDKIKIILMTIAVILGILGLLVAIGFIYSILFYGFILEVVCFGGYVAFRLFVKPETKQLQSPNQKS